MMDISDGLAADAPRLAQASGCGVLVHSTNVPIHPDASGMQDPLRAALEDGEDFELLVAISADAFADLADVLIPVGKLITEVGSWIDDGRGRRPSPYHGFEHQST
jgi:thiamine-monophosphate kinase